MEEGPHPSFSREKGEERRERERDSEEESAGEDQSDEVDDLDEGENGFSDEDESMDDKEEDSEEEEDFEPITEGKKEIPEGFVPCVECEESAGGKCDQCEDTLCLVCFQVLHRKGNRRTHNFQPLQSEEKSEHAPSPARQPEGLPFRLKEKSPAWFVDRAKYIPVRLSLAERKMLRLLESALQVIRYTDVVDVPTFKSPAHRCGRALQEIAGILAGLATSWDYAVGQEVVSTKDFKQFAPFYRRVFEIGRRHKVMNPEKMRSEYGKLVYLLQDAASKDAQENLGFSCASPMVTVYSFLRSKGVAHLLEDPHIATATMEIESRGRPRYEIQRDISDKERKREYISRKYATSKISDEDIKWCLYSIGDNHSYLHFNRDPVDEMIHYLKKYFSPDSYKEGYSLAISGGHDGARLTHNHKKQYHYVMQSLFLWREIAHDMFKLWVLAEQDILDPENPYALTDTGQGHHRVQQAPRVMKNIQRILVDTQAKVGSWVGSSVIHLGDKNVPNALMFIDKYTQVQRILNPIVLTLNEIARWRDNEKISTLIDETYGGEAKLKVDILVDFFRFAFDGSGADNFYDAGSCIDGRLTSAWNWCNKLNEKPFYHIFRLAGFAGFDGDFQT